MPTPSELVTDAFAQAQNYALTAQGHLSGYLASLASAVTVTPLVDVSFTPVAEPSTAATPNYEPPTPYTPPDPYTSALLGTVQSGISSRVTGGSGLAPGVEVALWDRAREREQATTQANIDRVMSDSEALGWALPPGVLLASVQREQRAYYDKAGELSRDIAIKQADLEQNNVQKALELGVSLEKALVDSNIQLEQLVVEADSKRIASAVEVYRSGIARFQAEVEQDVKHWEAAIKQNEAQITYTLNGQKINADIIHANTSALQEAAKVGAQVYSQLTAAAYSLIHASAGVTAGGSTSVSYSYSNDTSSTVPPVTSV